MKILSLNGNWILSGYNPETDEKFDITAKVPGCVLNDIINADVEKKDIFYRDNSEKFEKYERWDWHYSKEFEISELYAIAIELPLT
jgi:hypothetical protein